MNKIKNLLHPHGSHEDRDNAANVTHDANPTTHAPHGASAPTAPAAGEHTHMGTDGQIGSAGQYGTAGHHGAAGQHSVPAASGDSPRPEASPITGDANNANSEASIKSGIIGFAPDGRGNHAALPQQNDAEDRLRGDQIVGGGSGLKNELPNTESSASTYPPTSQHQPYQRSSMQESHAADTGRSFPLSGGVTSQHVMEKTSTPSGLTTSAREPGTKEREIVGHDNSGRAPLAAAAAATAAGFIPHSSHPDQDHVQTVGDNTGTIPHSDRSAASIHPSGTTHTTGQSSHPEALAAATAAASHASARSNAHEPSHSSKSNTLLDYEKAWGTAPTTQHTGLLSYRPQTHRSDTSPPIPGEFPGPTPVEELSEPSLGHANISSEPGTTDTSAHGLRHTGTLEEPQSRSVDHPSEHHHGRDAALAGGLGAAGVGAYAASQKHEPPAPANLYDDKNPYSSTTLDPRVTGGASKMEEQRFDPQVKAEPPALPSSAVRTSEPQLGSTALATQSEAEKGQHHYGRDAALVGGGVAAAGGLYSASQRDKPDTTSAVHSAHNTSSVPATEHASKIPVAQHSSLNSGYGKALPASEAPSASRQLQSNDPQHHYGRDATLAGAGAGAATAGGAYYASQHDDKPYTGPASETIGPHKSNIANILDPRVKPDPELQSSKAHDKTGSQDQHHYGRDAAVAGGAGAAGYGAYEAARSYGDHRSTQPQAAMTEQRYDPAASGARAPNPVPAYTEYNYNEKNFGGPNTGHSAESALTQDLGPKDNSSRNAALGAGAGLAGVSALGYAGAHHGDSSHPPLTSQTAGSPSAIQPGSSTLSHPTQGVTTHNRQDPYSVGGSQAQDPSQVPHERSHDKRDAALLGGAGAATAAGADYAYSQHQQPQYDPEDQKKMEKENQKRLHKIEKAEEKEAKHHDKDAKADDGEKKHSILGFLHRDKSRREKTPSPDSTPRRSRDSPRHSRDYAAPAAFAGTAGAPDSPSGSGSDHERWKARNRLHKEPPKGHPAREALEHQREGEYGGASDQHHYGRSAALGAGALGGGALGGKALAGHSQSSLPTHQSTTVPHDSPLSSPREVTSSGKRQHMGVDGPIGDPNLISGDRQTKAGTYGAHPISDLSQDRSVIEPHTGLPMNVGRYGDGSGGTDGNAAIGAGHHHEGNLGERVMPGHADPAHSTTDWEAIKKNDTIY